MQVCTDENIKTFLNLNNYEYSLLSEVTIRFNYVYLKMITLLTKRKGILGGVQ